MDPQNFNQSTPSIPTHPSVTPPAPPAPVSTPGNVPSQNNLRTPLHVNKYLLIALACAVIFGAYIFLSNRVANVNPHLLAQQPGAGETEVSDTASERTVPEGFPSNIPVESQNINQAFKIFYKDHGTTQYTVSFNSSVKKEDLWKTYSDVMLAGGYTRATTSDEALGLMQGARAKNELNISINPYGEEFLVSINYIDRQ